MKYYNAVILCSVGAGMIGFAYTIDNKEANPIAFACFLIGSALTCLGIYDNYSRKKREKK